MHISKLYSFNQAKNTIGYSSVPNFKGAISFKGKISEDKFEKKPDDDSKSKQLNDPEVQISPEMHMQIFANSSLADGVKEFLSEKKVDEIVDSIDDEDGFSKCAADNTVEMLKKIADDKYAKIPKDQLDKIPSFTKLDIEKYFAQYDKMNEGISNFNDNLQEEFALMNSESEEAEGVSTLAFIANELTQNLPDYSKLGEYLRLNKKDELVKIFTKLDKVNNYNIWQAVEAGFNRNPQKVINILTEHSFISTTPRITDNDEKTLKYQYAYFADFLETIRNKNNKDYVSFILGFDGNTKGTFNEDGTIKELIITNEYDKTSVKIIPNAKDKSLQVINLSDGDAAALREFKRTDDGSYKLTNMQIAYKG